MMRSDRCCLPILPLTSSMSLARNPSQKRQVPRDLVDLALRGRSHAKHRRRPTRNLRAAGVVDDSRAEAQTDGLRLQEQQVLLALHLDGNLGLPERLPALEDGMRRVCVE